MGSYRHCHRCLVGMMMKMPRKLTTHANIMTSQASIGRIGQPAYWRCASEPSTLGGKDAPQRRVKQEE